MAVRFSLWDLHLYLDTHPCDKTAATLYERYAEKYSDLLKKYECQFGPLGSDSAFGQEWFKAPWPWERSCDC